MISIVKLSRKNSTVSLVSWFRRIRLNDMARFSWEPSPENEAVTQYRLEKSIDKGMIFTALIVIDNLTSSPNYSSDDNQYFYEDNAPMDGEIVRIRAESASGNGLWDYVFCPPGLPKMCTLYGCLLDSMSGNPLVTSNVLFSIVRPPEIFDTQIPSIASNSLYALKTNVTKSTDSDGLFSTKIIQGSIARINIPELGYNLTFRVPEVDVINLTDLPQYEVSEHESHTDRR